MNPASFLSELRIVSLAGLLSAVFIAPLAAQVNQSHVGKDLVMTRDGVELRVLNPTTGQNRVIGTVNEASVRLKKIQGKWLWVRTSTQEGWVLTEDAVPAEQALDYFGRRIQQNADDGYAY